MLMLEKESLRKAIFRNELSYIFEKNKTSESDIYKIITTLFENPFDLSKQWLIKDNVLQHNQIITRLKNIGIDNNLIGEISSLFLVQDDLRIPGDIKKLFLGGEKVGVLVGAGVSKVIKLPLWKELGNKAIEHLYNSNKINFSEYQKIQTEMIDPKQKLTVFHNLIPRETKEAKNFYSDIFERSNSDINPSEINPYDLIVKLDWIKLTSNIDKEFFKALEKNYKLQPLIPKQIIDEDSIRKRKIAKWKSSNFSVNEIDNDTIYHIHGSLDAINETILTTRDYLESYHLESNLKEFLKKVFEEYTIIFIGYGLEEFSILEHIVNKTKPHFVLLPCYLHDINLFRLRNEYFKTLNIKAIPYYLDFEGYDRLYYVLKAWTEQIIESLNSQYYDNIRKIDEVL